MPTAFEKIGELLVQKGLLTRDQLDACIREVLQSQGTDRPLLLSEVLVSKGYADRATLTQTVQVLADAKFQCSKCRTPYTIRNPKIDAPYVCKRCGGALEVVDVVPSQSPKPPAAAPKAGPPSEVAEAAKDPKRVLGKYTLVKELGRGGTAVVYKAWDETLDQYVALKLIRTQDLGLTDEPKDETVQEFLREARTAVKLQHPNIVRVYELGRHGDRYVLSMEYVQGKSLADLLRRGRDSRALPFYGDVNRFLGYLRDAAGALDYSHHRTPPIVHRDIKPQNVLVDDNGRVCVVDFGLAKELMGSGQLTRTGVAKGTPCYMAPEQATGKPIDGRTDVYALGAVLYEFLTGQPPFTGPTEREILNKIVADEPVPPSALLKSKGVVVPPLPELERICLKALEKAKERRYRTAGEFAEELTRFLQGEEVQARPVSGAERAWRWLLKRKAVAIPTAASIVLGVVALVAVSRGKAERVVERVRVVAEVDPERKSALETIDRLEAGFRFNAAARACDELLRKASDDGQRSALRQKRDDFRLQAELFDGLSMRISPSLPAQESFRLLGEPPGEVRFLGADPESLRLLRQGRSVTVSWARVDPRQLLDLVKLAWPDMEPRPTLALGVWCLRQGLSDEAAALFGRPGTADARRYQEELKASDLTEQQQVARLVKEAESALAKEDLVIARARFERALVLAKDDPRVLKGLEKVAEIEKKKEVAAPVEAKAPAPVPAPAAKPDLGPAHVINPPSPIVGPYTEIHSRFVQAMNKVDLPVAAEEWEKGQRLLGNRAVSFPRVGTRIDLKEARPLMGDVETWLNFSGDTDDLVMRQVFALRDLLAVSLTVAELDAAIDRLIQGKVEVNLRSLSPGKVRTGTLQRSKGTLYLNEAVAVGGDKGTVGTAILVRPGDSKSVDFIDIANLLSNDRKKSGSTDVRRRLGETLLISYGPTGELKYLDQLEKDVDGTLNGNRFRLKKYLSLRREPIVFRMDLLAGDAAEKWSRSGNDVQVDDKGLLLRGSPEVFSVFEGLWLEPGMRVEIRLQVEKSDVPGQGELDFGLLVAESGTSLEPAEFANVFLNANPPVVSFFDVNHPPPGDLKFVAYHCPPGDPVDLYLEYLPSGTIVAVCGSKIGALAYRAPGRRLLGFTARKVQVRISKILVSGNPQSAVTKIPDKAPPPSEPAKVQELIAAGKTKLNSGDIKGAIASFTEALGSEPADPAAIYILRGDAHLTLNEQSAAQIDYKEAIKLGGYSNTAGASLGLGRIRMLHQDFLQAITDFTESLSQSPRQVLALRLRALCYWFKEMFPQSLDDITAAMKLEPDYSGDYVHRGLIAYRYGRWSLAVDDLKQAMKLGSGADEAVAYYIWVARCRLGERAAATAELRRFAAGRTSSNPLAAWNLKLLSFLLGDLSEAGLTAASSTSQGPMENPADLPFSIGTKRLLDGDTAGAREFFAKAVGTNAIGSYELILAKGELARLDGKPDEPMPALAAPPPAAVAKPADPAPAAPAVPAKAVGKADSADEAARHAVAVLKASAPTWPVFDFNQRKMSYRELALWALLSAGVPADDSDFKTLLNSMLQDKLETTVCVAMQAVVLERLDRVKYQKRIAMCGQFLVDNQSARGDWGYGSPSIYVEDLTYSNNKRVSVQKQRDGEGGDNINSFFAALGLRACRNAGVGLPKNVLLLAMQWIQATQKRGGAVVPMGPAKSKDGIVGDPRGWCYFDHADHEAYGSITAAMVAAEAMLVSILDDDGGKKASWKRDKTVQDGVAWLAKNYSVTYNPGPYEHAQMEVDSKNQHFFYLFALEQAMDALGMTDLGTHAWYADGCKFLQETQANNGTWRTTIGTPDVPVGKRFGYATSDGADLCFAILFLKKAGQPLPDASKPKK